jgi:threonine dehydratase
LSDITGADVWLKFENLQFTASFKERGALNRLSALTAEERGRGVIAMSAGNHAQGVAYHAKRLGIPATIVMPQGTPLVKIENTRGHGAEVIIEGPTLEDSAAFARGHGDARGLTFIHPYDDALVMAGQGTIALEMLSAVPDLDTLVIPIGGGGLISGMAVAAKALKPDIRVIGVQAELYPSMYNRIKGTDLPMRGDTLAEGIAVKKPGELTSQVVARYVDDIVLVPENMIERAVALLISIEKTVVEGAGAAGLAALLAHRTMFQGAKVGLVLCGGNIDIRLLASVLTRELAREGRLSQLTIDLVDRPGQLAKVASVLGEAGANIVEVSHQRTFSDLPAKGTLLEVVIETRDRIHLQEVIGKLTDAGFTVDVHSNPGGSHA